MGLLLIPLDQKSVILAFLSLRSSISGMEKVNRSEQIERINDENHIFRFEFE